MSAYMKQKKIREKKNYENFLASSNTSDISNISKTNQFQNQVNPQVGSGRNVGYNQKGGVGIGGVGIGGITDINKPQINPYMINQNIPQNNLFGQQPAQQLFPSSLFGQSTIPMYANNPLYKNPYANMNMNTGIPQQIVYGQQSLFPQNQQIDYSQNSIGISNIAKPQQTQQKETLSTNQNQFSSSIYNGLKTEDEKREYLGELIFHKIEDHPLSKKLKLNEDDLGKITGMILGIDDISEVLDIAKLDDQLENRIEEAYSLLKDSEAN